VEFWLGQADIHRVTGASRVIEILDMAQRERLSPWFRRSSDLDRGGPLARRANTAGQPMTRSGGAILRPQICGAVSKRGCNQIERRIYSKLLQTIQ
jgi:hypothetical protein